MTSRGKDRTQAVRLARKAKYARDADRARRESLIEAALADYDQAAAKAERIRADARRKADAVLAAAEQNAAGFVAAARAAVRRLRDLLGGNAEVAQLCGITPAKVREYLAADPGYSGLSRAELLDRLGVAVGDLPAPHEPGVSG